MKQAINWEYETEENVNYAKYQMALHHHLCAKARGVNTPRPLVPTTHDVNVDASQRIDVPCARCGKTLAVKKYYARLAKMKYGGSFCPTCRAQRSAEGMRQRCKK